MTDTALGWIVVLGFALLVGAVVYLWQESRDQAKAYNLTQERVARELERHEKLTNAFKSNYGALLAQQETRFLGIERRLDTFQQISETNGTINGLNCTAMAHQEEITALKRLAAESETRLRILEEGVSLAAPEPEKTVSRARGSWRDIAARAEAGSDKNGALDELRK